MEYFCQIKILDAQSVHVKIKQFFFSFCLVFNLIKKKIIKKNVAEWLTVRHCNFQSANNNSFLCIKANEMCNKFIMV